MLRPLQLTTVENSGIHRLAPNDAVLTLLVVASHPPGLRREPRLEDEPMPPADVPRRGVVSGSGEPCAGSRVGDRYGLPVPVMSWWSMLQAVTGSEY